MIRVELPQHLRTLAHIEGEVAVHVNGEATPDAILCALEAQYPMLRGTIRDQVTHRRRDFLRYFACQEDISHEPSDLVLPNAIATGNEPLMIVGAIAGG
jgi:molybdopterin synthase sulfur carrier subunit